MTLIGNLLTVVAVLVVIWLVALPWYLKRWP